MGGWFDWGQIEHRGLTFEAHVFQAPRFAI
jgi:hypothetical protein